MNIDILEITYSPVTTTYRVRYWDMDEENSEEESFIQESTLLDYIVLNNLNVISPNGQEDFEPYKINPKRALEQFEDEIIKHYIVSSKINVVEK